ncbi:alpha/beta hydrolase [Aspergillus candidus]|uniref:Alpha/Beta hydrolase protein n=1 Tax=Aspergillus candidus TaxID=41067 RepID=A0A2I2F7C9_ASPCN|nr:Alpha/Beta hydrolase protein [Aspergillus candidus]PLB36537.1 Alpha/Beta hydrolase protein [Aspergillus candidus]
MSTDLHKLEIHPDLQEMQKLLSAGPRFNLVDDLDKARAAFDLKIETIIQGYEETISYEDTNIPGPTGPMKTTILRPKHQKHTTAEDTPGILHIHGGGHCMGSRFFGANTVLPCITALGAVCVTAEYRLAPEHPQPAQLDDTYAALAWMSDHAQELGFNPRKLIVYGGSAGGNLAAGVSLLARDRAGPSIFAQVLIYPWLDDSNETFSMKQCADIQPWTRQKSMVACDYALGKNREHVSAYTVPSHATDLEGLPPALIDAGTADLFRDEGVDFAAALLRAGVSVELHLWPGCWHGFDTIVPDAPISRRAVAARVEWLRDLLSRS